MGVNVPTVEMITMELVQAYIARGVLVSLLCQSKNSEVLNTFHPNSGGGLTMPLEKSVEKYLVCQFLRLVILQVSVRLWCYCHARRTQRQGCSRNYILRIKYRYCVTVYVIWPQDGYLPIYGKQAAVKLPPTQTGGKKGPEPGANDSACINIHTVTCTLNKRGILCCRRTHTHKWSCTWEQRKVDRALMG